MYVNEDFCLRFCSNSQMFRSLATGKVKGMSLTQLILRGQLRNKKTSVKTNVNYTEENPMMFSKNVAPVQALPFQMDTESVAQKGRETLRTKHERSTSRENSDVVRSSGSPLHHNIVHCTATNASLRSSAGIQSFSSCHTKIPQI